MFFFFFNLHHTQRYWIGYYIQKNKTKTLVALANKPLLMLYSRNSNCDLKLSSEAC